MKHIKLKHIVILLLLCFFLFSCGVFKKSTGVKTSCYHSEKGWKFVLFQKSK